MQRKTVRLTRIEKQWQDNMSSLLKRRLQDCPAAISKWIPYSRKNIIEVVLKQQAKPLEDPMMGS